MAQLLIEEALELRLDMLEQKAREKAETRARLAAIQQQQQANLEARRKRG